MSIPIYVIGSSNTDMVVKSSALPRPGETVLGGTFFMNPGGKGANQAVAAARLGGDVTFVCRVGDDLFGAQALTQFTAEGIQTQFITKDTALPSGVALIMVDEAGENSIAVAPGANNNLTRNVLVAAVQHIQSPSILLVQLEIPLDSVTYAIETGRALGATVILNPAPSARLEPALLGKVSLITPNESEAEGLTGIQVKDSASAMSAAEQLHRWGVPVVVITMGSKGAFWSSEGNHGMVHAPEVSALDTTAAGDCFNGALAAALSEGLPLEAALQFSCRAAALSVTRLGAQASMPYRRELIGD
jgi:ribokinase